MEKWGEQPLLVISAGRTKDLAGWHPAHLADVLGGRAPARVGPRSPAVTIEPERVGAVVLWTKQPEALLHSPPLVRLLENLGQRQVLVVLQLSVTGLGGSPLEPGIPDPFAVAGTLEAILGRGLLAGPDCVKLRWDPVAEYDLGAVDGGPHRGKRLVLSNASTDLFHPVFERYQALGAATWTSSVLDLKYRGAADRLSAAGIAVRERGPERYRPFYSVMSHAVQSAGGRFSLCCSPALEPWVSGDGCIDGAWINGLRRTYFGSGAPTVETVLHNRKRRGGQRPRCGCSYSLDVSYSAGFRTCATQVEEGGLGGCCLYCYSWHGRAGAATAHRVASAVEALRARPPLEGVIVDGAPFWHQALRVEAVRDER